MDTHFNSDGTVTLTATFENLRDIQGSGQKIWATPNTDGEIAQVYVNSFPSWRDDFVCAHVSEFENCGIGFSDDDMTEDELDAVREDEYTVTIPIKG